MWYNRNIPTKKSDERGIFTPRGKPNNRYSGEFKQRVVETMQKEHLSYREAVRQFEISDHKLVAKWERIYLEEGVGCFTLTEEEGNQRDSLQNWIKNRGRSNQ